jgi:hypothetical protein
MRVLVIAIETIQAVEPMVEDEKTSAHIRNQVQVIKQLTKGWPE